MKNKKKILIVSGILFAIIALISLVLLFGRNENENALTISEKKWLEDKNNTANLIDVSINNDIPVFGNNGSGIFFSFISYLEKETGLHFNLIPYKTTQEVSGDYYFQVSSSKSDLSFYQSNYVLLNKDMKNIVSLDKVKETIGLLKKDEDALKKAIDVSSINIKTYEDVTALLDAFEKEEVPYILLPNITYINTILSNQYKIVYHLNDMKENFSLVLKGENKTLNSIITKYFRVWKENRFSQEFDKAYLSVYYYIKSLTDEQKTNLLSKQYVYGYVDYAPYEQVIDNELVGINAGIINRFSDLTGIDFSWKQYHSVKELESAIERKEVDLAYNFFPVDTSNVTKTMTNMNIEYVVLSKQAQVITSLQSITGKIYMYEESYLKNYINGLLENEISIQTELKRLSNIKDGVIIIDRNIYNYYRNTIFSSYLVVFDEVLETSNKFVVNNSNQDFLDIFNFFLMNFQTKELQTMGYNNLLETPQGLSIFHLIFDNIIAVLIILIILVFGTKFLLQRHKKAIPQIKKEDRLKFVDMLTSLKNRNYLNHNIAIWEENTIYPQTIIIVDLNNIQYINDNYGHEEGDNIIKMAANILINNQLQNSDIIRTDGNEFLIYLVGQQEKEIISYMRKLYKELKDLPHGFGAAMGYSIIDDDIKSIDDAINEATLDMRTNKER